MLSGFELRFAPGSPCLHFHPLWHPPGDISLPAPSSVEMDSRPRSGSVGKHGEQLALSALGRGSRCDG